LEQPKNGFKLISATEATTLIEFTPALQARARVLILPSFALRF